MKATINGVAVEGTAEDIIAFCQDIKAPIGENWNTTQYALDQLEQSAEETIQK